MNYLTSDHEKPPTHCVYGDGRVETQVLVDRQDVVTLVNNDIYAHYTAEGIPSLGYEPWVRVPAEPADYYERSLSGTQEERDAATVAQTRSSLESDLEDQRVQSNQREVDLLRDPGIAVLMDEANACAEAKLIELDGTADEDLTDFDLTFDPLAVGSIATARSLVTQETALTSDPGLTQGELDDLSAAITAHQAVIDAGDDQAAVAPAPFSLRRLIGTPGEDYGVLIAKRLFIGGWWQLAFELRTERELDVSEYWIALYQGDGTYLTTPRLTKVADGVYEAGPAAVNIQSSDTSTEYAFTVCRGHITEEQFAKVTLPSGVEAKRYRVRWGGNVGSGGGSGTEWVNTGATVVSQAGQLYQISDEAVASGLTPGQTIRFTETGTETTFVGVWAGGADYLEIDPFVQAYVGDALWSFQ